MKRIIKNKEPKEFIDWKSNWETPPDWTTFDGKPIKQLVKRTLLEEQGYICCFCENRVMMDHGHIAHLLDRKQHPELVLEYGNILYSCPENPKKEPQTCGHAQKNQTLPISPLDEDCENHFIYNGETGEILPRKNSNKFNEANETIRILNLNGSKVLREKRLAIYQETKNNKSELTSNEFEIWLNHILNRNTENKFIPFWTTIKYAAQT
ncbi:MAG: TIGR02646 family protein [Planctomycetaceae bacterium]|jgi:uncharacterized protein (TIGR02646 family)|nr:TIGR02646 family protein [Planctomycetaceae bacterium]